ncbi:MAG: hypothetical protein O3C43_22630 [Verrucomicrobia bacterium]|nr:hypothetical protein [Verrucomicrobiota bacterium]MDA1069288.1 hypothetical protein [Verrucomicrobiota bacterium]
MWNSPHKIDDAGLKYELLDISALVYPLGLLMDMQEDSSPSDTFVEDIVCRMEKEEVVFALFEVLQALLEDTPIPEKGHTGYQEAIVFELLNACFGQIQIELGDSNFGDSARKAAWTSFDRLCLQSVSGEEIKAAILGELPLDYSDPTVHRSAILTDEIWYEIVVGEGCLPGQFLWDYDYRIDRLMELPESMTEQVRESTGIDLEVVHRLPYTPTDAEYKMAKHYLQYVDWKLQTTEQ